MAKLVDLKPKKDLLDPTFEGYKLILDALPVYKHELPGAIEHLKPNEEQFSFQHVKLFGLHNHLISDPWLNKESVYFIANKSHIYKVNTVTLVSCVVHLY